MDYAQKATEKLANEGIEATVVNARFAKPLDKELIVDLVDRIKRVVTVEENVLSGGFGSNVLTMLQEEGISEIKALNIGVPDKFIEHGTQEILRKKYGLDEEGIANKVMELFPGHRRGKKRKIPDKAKASSA